MTFFDTLAFLVGFGSLAFAALTLRANWLLRDSCRVLREDLARAMWDGNDARRRLAARDNTIVGLRAALSVAMNQRGVS